MFQDEVLSFDDNKMAECYGLLLGLKVLKKEAEEGGNAAKIGEIKRQLRNVQSKLKVAFKRASNFLMNMRPFVVVWYFPLLSSSSWSFRHWLIISFREAYVSLFGFPK
jgi:hypothetical protein